MSNGYKHSLDSLFFSKFESELMLKVLMSRCGNDFHVKHVDVNIRRRTGAGQQDAECPSQHPKVSHQAPQANHSQISESFTD
jgi:hypothetical protein